TRSKRDWSSDVCSSDLCDAEGQREQRDAYSLAGLFQGLLRFVHACGEVDSKDEGQPRDAENRSSPSRFGVEKGSGPMLQLPDEPRSEEHTSELQSRFDL